MVKCGVKQGLLSCMLAGVMLLSVTGCAQKEDGSIPLQELKVMDEESYTVVNVNTDDLRDDEIIGETVYCNGSVFYFKERIIDNMRLDPEYYSVGCMDVETGQTRILYEAPMYTVLQDIIAAEDKVYWVEIDYGEVSEWKIVAYDLAQGTMDILRESVLEVDSCWEAVLELSGRYILWVEKRPAGDVSVFSYSLDEGTLKENPLPDADSYDDYSGDIMYNGEVVYLLGRDGSYEIKSDDKVYYQFTAEDVGCYYVTEQGILWGELGTGENKAWFVRMKKGAVIGQAQMLPYQNVFSSNLYGEWVVTANEGSDGNLYYHLLNINTGERYRIPAEGDFYPRRSADGTIYFKGSGSVLLVELPETK